MTIINSIINKGIIKNKAALVKTSVCTFGSAALYGWNQYYIGSF